MFVGLLSDANEIIPNIWVGNEKSSQNSNFMKKNNIRLIINATKHIPNTFKKEIDYFRIPVNDPGPYQTIKQSDVNTMAKYLPHVLPVIHAFSKRGYGVLIHCHAGVQRSAAVMAAYIITYCVYVNKNSNSFKCNQQKGRKVSLEDAVKYIVKKRPQAFYFGQYVNFKEALWTLPINL